MKRATGIGGIFFSAKKTPLPRTSPKRSAASTPACEPSLAPLPSGLARALAPRVGGGLYARYEVSSSQDGCVASRQVASMVR